MASFFLWCDEVVVIMSVLIQCSGVEWVPCQEEIWSYSVYWVGFPWFRKSPESAHYSTVLFTKFRENDDMAIVQYSTVPALYSTVLLMSYCTVKVTVCICCNVQYRCFYSTTVLTSIGASDHTLFSWYLRSFCTVSRAVLNLKPKTQRWMTYAQASVTNEKKK